MHVTNALCDNTCHNKSSLRNLDKCACVKDHISAHLCLTYITVVVLHLNMYNTVIFISKTQLVQKHQNTMMSRQQTN